MTGRIDNNAPTGEGEPRIVEIGRGIYTIEGMAALKALVDPDAGRQ